MADNGFKINKSANLNPQTTAPANPVDGDIYYDSTAQSFAYYHNGSWANMDSVGTVAFVEPLTSTQFTPAVVRNSVIKVTGHAVPIHLKGISSSFSGKMITVYNGGSGLITVEYDDAGEPTSNNRILTPTGGDMNLIAGEVAVFTYDVVANRWLLVSISSQGGAQVIATTGHPGLVTLHQASLTPADGIVLSDGDLNTATGVVGLDANRAATIAAPTAAVPTLTLSQNAGSVALMQKPGSDVDRFTLSDTAVQLGQRQLRFSDNDGFGNHFNNYMVNTSLGSVGTRGISMVNQTNLGTGRFDFMSTGDGAGGVRVDMLLHATSGTDQYITNQQGDLYLNFLQSQTTHIGMAAGGAVIFGAASTDLWKFTGAGVLTAVGANRAIQSVLDPVNAQDAATKAYTDRNAGALNLVINGSFDFWQRGAAVKNLAGCNKTATHSALATVYNIRYGADRWYAEVSDNATGSTNNTCSLTRQSSGLNTSPFCCRVTGVGAGGGSQLLFGMSQELDRDLIPQIRGKTLIVQFKIRADATYIANGGNTQVRITSGTDAGGNIIRRNYAGATSVLAPQTISNASLTSNFQTFTYVSGSPIPNNCTELALNFSGGGTGAVTHYFEIAEVMIFAGLTTTPDYFVRHGGTFGAEKRACERFYEKSYEWDTTPGTVINADKDGAIVYFWPSQIATSFGAPLPIGSHPRYRVEKWKAAADSIDVTFFRYDTLDTVGSWLINNGATVQAVTATGTSSQQGFVILADASVGAVGNTTDSRTIRGCWASSGDIGDSA